MDAYVYIIYITAALHNKQDYHEIDLGHSYPDANEIPCGHKCCNVGDICVYK